MLTQKIQCIKCGNEWIKPLTEYQAMEDCIRSIFTNEYISSLELSPEEKKDIAVSLFIQTSRMPNQQMTAISVLGNDLYKLEKKVDWIIEYIKKNGKKKEAKP